MEPYQKMMEAYLDRFNLIKVKVCRDYYQGKVEYFYLRDVTLNRNLQARIIHEEIYEQYHMYHLMVENVRLGHEYFIVNNYGLSVELINFGIVNDPMFDHLFSYDGEDLGPTYSKEATQFKVWAPTASKVKIEYSLNQNTYVVGLKRINSGVFSVTIQGDLEGASYVYLIKNGQHYDEATDPYAYSSTANGLRSVVIDLSKIIRLPQKVLPAIESKTDIIIYEMSVRDFTISPSTNHKYPGLFLGLCEKGTCTNQLNVTGIDYLSSLGITHVQLMPIFDFATVDENDRDLIYNWGYDPQQYNVPEGSYSSDVSDPYKRIQECIQMIECLHENNLRVVMDVVYNHVFDLKMHAFEKIVPYYYFRNDDNGVLSNGSFCGNDLNSASFMVRKYIIDMCKRWQELYRVDGYRFDLMGVLDIDTVNEVESVCVKGDPNFIVYGEGWDLPTMLPKEQKAMMFNHQQMPNISFFNDVFRDSLKGNSMQNAGFLLGNRSKIYDVMKVLCPITQFSSITQSINFVECHDNTTIFDHMEISMREDIDIRKRRQKMFNTLVVLSQGIVFLHCGQEFCRTKYCHDNTYNLPDEINQIDWDYRDEYIDQVELVQMLIELRKNNKAFRYQKQEDIDRYIKIWHIDESVLVYQLKQDEGLFKQITILINPTYSQYIHQLEIDELVFYSLDEHFKIDNNYLTIEPVSMYILVKE